MLHAVNRKKARMDAFRGPGQRVPLEDVVTSTIFGPLLFLDQAEAEAAVSRILTTLGITPPRWDGPTHLSLWPRRTTVEALRSKYIEPDAEIVDSTGNSLSIEVKWGARLSEMELASQWLSLSPEARTTSRHLLIALETQPYCASIEADRRVIVEHCALPWPIHAVSWRRMADAFQDIGRDLRLNPGTRRWALGVHGFLRREDPLSLAGWDGLELAPVDPLGWRFARAYFSTVDETAASAWRFADGWFEGCKTVVEPTSWSFN